MWAVTLMCAGSDPDKGAQLNCLYYLTGVNTYQVHLAVFSDEAIFLIHIFIDVFCFCFMDSSCLVLCHLSVTVCAGRGYII